MSPADPALSDPAAAPADAPARALIEAQVAVLTRLTEIGMEIAEAVGREAKTAATEAREDAPRPDHALLFARVSRAVRMTIALQSRLMKDLAALDRADDLLERARATRRRIRLGRLVEDAVEDSIAAQRAAGRRFSDEDAVEDEIERLAEEACERLADAEEDLDGLAFHDAVAAICADLNLSPDWTARLIAATGGASHPSPPPLGEVAAKRTERAFPQGAAPWSPLHHPSGGPPPPEGEEKAPQSPSPPVGEGLRRRADGHPSANAEWPAQREGEGSHRPVRPDPQPPWSPLHHPSGGPPPPEGEEIGRQSPSPLVGEGGAHASAWEGEGSHRPDRPNHDPP